MKGERETFGFLINPIAGMGGTVGLKGTDGLMAEAVRRGATPRASIRAEAALRLLSGAPVHFLTCAGAMGEDSLSGTGLSFDVVYTPKGTITSAEDTKAACNIFLKQGVSGIVFCGGDGTARDIYDIVGQKVPIIGIPAGVKMYSAVFAITPAAAAELITKSGQLPTTEAEIMDVDEEAYRNGRLSTTLHGYARTPTLPLKRQQSKWVSVPGDEDQALLDIARFICEIMREDTLYFLGAGTTTSAVADRLGLEHTLLGVDAVRSGVLVGRDLDESGMLALLKDHSPAKIIVSPIGAQGFILGRGNQQISPEVLRMVGIKNVIVVATPQKLERTPVLYIDSGDADLDSRFGDSILVISGYRMGQRKRLIHA